MIEIREGISQNWIGNKVKTRVILNQLSDVIIDVEGSKIEKIFIIIFSFNVLIYKFFD